MEKLLVDSTNNAKRFNPVEERIEPLIDKIVNVDILKLFVIIEVTATSKTIKLIIPMEENSNSFDLVYFPRMIKPT